MCLESIAQEEPMMVATTSSISSMADVADPKMVAMSSTSTRASISSIADTRASITSMADVPDPKMVASLSMSTRASISSIADTRASISSMASVTDSLDAQYARLPTDLATLRGPLMAGASEEPRVLRAGVVESGNSVPFPWAAWTEPPPGFKEDSGAQGRLPEGAVISIGSMKHPHGCAQPCRHVRRKGGCREGANCEFCHLCVWHRRVVSSRPPDSEVAEIKRQPAYVHISEDAVPSDDDAGRSHAAIVWATDPPPAYNEAPGAAKAFVPTIGSIGHPHSCRRPCKYNSRRRGCKEGPLCSRCHLCTWSRILDRMGDGACPLKHMDCGVAPAPVESYVRF